MRRALRGYAEGLAGLPRPVYGVLVAFGVSAVGSGLVAPFHAVYLAHVRGFSAATTGAVLGAIAVAALVTSPAGGRLVDSYGPRPIATAGCLAQAVGYAALGVAARPGAALAAASAIGAGNGLFFPALVPALAALVPEDRRRQVYALRYATNNLALGTGAAAGGLALAAGSSARFTTVYALDGLSFAALALCLYSIVPDRARHRRPAGGSPPPARPRRRPGAALLANRPLALLVGLNTLAVGFGYAQLSSTVPLYAAGLGISTALIGLMYTLNTATVVLCQVPINHRSQRHHPARVLSSAGRAWAAAWAVAAVAAWSPRPLQLSFLFLFYGLFAVGECYFAPSVPALTMDFAEDGRQGAATAAVTMSYNLGSMIGPALGLWGLHALPRGTFLVVLAGGGLVVATGARRLARYSGTESMAVAA